MSIKINEFHKDRLKELYKLCESFSWYDVALLTDWYYSSEDYVEPHDGRYEFLYDTTGVLHKALVAALRVEMRLIKDYGFVAANKETEKLITKLKGHLEFFEDWTMSDPLENLRMYAIKEFNEGRTKEGLIDG